MTELTHTKQKLRSETLAVRDRMSRAIRSAASIRLGGFADFDVSNHIVSAYHAIGSELDPEPLMQVLVGQGAQLALPVLLDQETMVFRRWDRSCSLVPVGFRTLGPDAGQPEVLPDLILAPLAAFSSTGQRIGYGKGHYDRALSQMHVLGHVPTLVGLAFDEQEVPCFPVEDHDIALDAVLTPSGLRVLDHGRDALAPFLR